MSSSRPLWRDEWPLLFVWASALAWLLHGKAWIAGLSSPLAAAGFLAWVCLAMCRGVNTGAESVWLPELIVCARVVRGVCVICANLLCFVWCLLCL